jgi:RNA polymerase sigma-70 factor, ECF subfamily
MHGRPTRGQEADSASVFDPDIFADLVRVHEQPMLNYATRLSHGDQRTAQDIVQDVFLKIWRSRLPLHPSDARGYLLTMVRNRAIDRSRSSLGRKEASLPDLRSLSTGAAADEAVLERIHMANVLRRLPAKDEQVLAELYLHDRSVQQTAELLAVPTGTVRSRCFYALRRLRNLLEIEDREFAE